MPGWGGAYEVSDAGRLRSVDRTASDGRTLGGSLLAQRVNRDGYLVVTLGSGAQRRTVGVHRLVVAAFRGSNRRYSQVRHLNGNRQDNRLVNLRNGDQRLNERDKGGGNRTGDKRKDRKGETGEVGQRFPGTDGCFCCFPGRRESQ